MDESLDRKNLVVMKLLHYFITEKNYNPIILQGAEDEIWLENLESDYKIIRIVSNHIHNEEQLDFDLYKARHIIKKIKKKTFSLKMNALSIFTDLGDNVELKEQPNIDCIYLYDEKDIKKYDFLYQYFPDINKKLKFSEEGLQLFIKITNDINHKNKRDAEKVEEIFKPKKNVVTMSLITINVVIYLFMLLFGQYDYMINEFALYGPYVIKLNQYYRLITSAFLHANIFHLLFNCYALHIIGSQIENYMGRIKYLIVYFASAVVGSLFSILLTNGVSVGASGAVFGLMGSLLYFGYHYRVYLGTVLKSQIIPLIVINLLIGFSSSGIDNFAHIGGLIGGALSTVAVGVKYKSTKFEMVNGLIVLLLLIAFLIFMSSKYIG
ncbi:MAG: rhomboid family intramembrane serine protease [Bacilli bacterium]|nr:rhomboid family intramembrane serine protease [Bacilli bacterium]